MIELKDMYNWERWYLEVKVAMQFVGCRRRDVRLSLSDVDWE